MPLYIISTPIGNLKDITLRAIETLKQADLILAEDTRRTSILLNHYDIKNRLVSYNDNNKEKFTPSIIEKLKYNQNIALVSDAGTPGISDPGFYLVREARKHKINIIPIPGPTASITALTASGFPTDKFQFLGFLSKKKKKKKATVKRD
jgi:16S rRNA (cytidine1402-2'-O)-methyltransferase